MVNGGQVIQNYYPHDHENNNEDIDFDGDSFDLEISQ